MRKSESKWLWLQYWVVLLKKKHGMLSEVEGNLMNNLVLIMLRYEEINTVVMCTLWWFWWSLYYVLSRLTIFIHESMLPLLNFNKFYTTNHLFIDLNFSIFYKYTSNYMHYQLKHSITRKAKGIGCF